MPPASLGAACGMSPSGSRLRGPRCRAPRLRGPRCRAPPSPGCEQARGREAPDTHPEAPVPDSASIAHSPEYASANDGEFPEDPGALRASSPPRPACYVAKSSKGRLFAVVAILIFSLFILPGFSYTSVAHLHERLQADARRIATLEGTFNDTSLDDWSVLFRSVHSRRMHSIRPRHGSAAGKHISRNVKGAPLVIHTTSTTTTTITTTAFDHALATAGGSQASSSRGGGPLR